MNIQNAQIGMNVVRSKGDYVVGYTGNIIEIDTQKNRVRVDWIESNTTWVTVANVEPTSIPYKITPIQFDRDGRRTSWPKYSVKSITEQFNEYLTSLGITSEEAQNDVAGKYGHNVNTMAEVMKIAKTYPAEQAKAMILKQGLADHSLLEH